MNFVRAAILLCLLVGIVLVDHVVDRHCAELRAEKPGNSCDRIAASVDVPVAMFHRIALVACLIALAAMLTEWFVGDGPRKETLLGDAATGCSNVLWFSCVIILLLALGLSFFYEGLADGYEVRGGAAMSLTRPFFTTQLSEFGMMVGTLSLMIIGPLGMSKR